MPASPGSKRNLKAGDEDTATAAALGAIDARMAYLERVSLEGTRAIVIRPHRAASSPARRSPSRPREGNSNNISSGTTTTSSTAVLRQLAALPSVGAIVGAYRQSLSEKGRLEGARQSDSVRFGSHKRDKARRSEGEKFLSRLLRSPSRAGTSDSPTQRGEPPMLLGAGTCGMGPAADAVFASNDAKLRNRALEARGHEREQTRKRDEAAAAAAASQARPTIEDLRFAKQTRLQALAATLRAQRDADEAATAALRAQAAEEKRAQRQEVQLQKDAARRAHAEHERARAEEVAARRALAEGHLEALLELHDEETESRFGYIAQVRDAIAAHEESRRAVLARTAAANAAIAETVRKVAARSKALRSDIDARALRERDQLLAQERQSHAAKVDRALHQIQTQREACAKQVRSDKTQNSHAIAEQRWRHRSAVLESRGKTPPPPPEVVGGSPQNHPQHGKAAVLDNDQSN